MPIYAIIINLFLLCFAFNLSKQMRSSLDRNSAITLGNSIVHSKLDYCNSLFYNLPQTSVIRLQRVQNSLARVVVPSAKRSNHITPTLNKLHWLPVKKGIEFKIAALTYKILQKRYFKTSSLPIFAPHKKRTAYYVQNAYLW